LEKERSHYLVKAKVKVHCENLALSMDEQQVSKVLGSFFHTSNSNIGNGDEASSPRGDPSEAASV
jgi:hypothetical protein